MLAYLYNEQIGSCQSRGKLFDAILEKDKYYNLEVVIDLT
jgi:hypothetical protein